MQEAPRRFWRKEIFREKVERLGFRKPFIIRAHHLHTFARFPNDGLLPPLEAAENIFRAVSTNNDPSYVKDVLGNTPEEADRFKLSVEDFFITFTKLPDNYPVKLVGGQKDQICKGCAHAKHCTTQESSKGDMQYLQGFFTSTANRLGLSGEIRYKLETTTTDAGKTRTLSALTTAGVIRKVLTEFWN